MHMDGFRPSIIGLVLGIIVVFSLLVWFFLAQVTLYRSSETATLSPEGMISAEFPSETIAQIQPGQSGVWRMETGQDQRPVAIPVIVYEIHPGGNQVTFYATDTTALPDPIPEGLKGRVDVEVEYVTPADLVLRASGKFLEGSRIPTSPQVQQGQ
jgi:hypothetical protein